MRAAGQGCARNMPRIDAARNHTGASGVKDRRTEFLMTDGSGGVCNLDRPGAIDLIVVSTAAAARLPEGNLVTRTRVAAPYFAAAQ